MTCRLILLSPPGDPRRREARFPPDAHAHAPVAPPALSGSLRDAIRRARTIRCAPGASLAWLADAIAAGSARVEASDLREVDVGRWAGQALADVEAEEPTLVAAWLTDSGARPHGGEAFTDVAGRVGGWLDTLHRETGTSVAVVPSLIARVACLNALGVATPALWRLDLEPGTWADLRSDGRRWALRAAGLPISPD